VKAKATQAGGRVQKFEQNVTRAVKSAARDAGKMMKTLRHDAAAASKKVAGAVSSRFQKARQGARRAVK
jgi:hypothetical protein